MYIKKRFESKNDGEIERAMDIIADVFLDRNVDTNKVDYLMSYYDDYIRTQLKAGKSPEEIAGELDTDINPDEAKVASPKDTQISTANAVRDFLATYLKNELVDSVDLDYAVRTYDDVYPYLEVVDKDSPGSGSYLTVWVYSPLGDGNFKIAYKYFEHPNNRIDCPTNVTGLEGVAKMLVQIVDGKPTHSEGADSFDDYLAKFKDEFETQWGPWGWEKAYALVLGNEEWMQEIKDNWANHDYDPAEMAEFAIENWFGDDESKSEGASTYTFTWWDNAPTAERRPTTRADLKNSKHKETFTAKDDADALEQAVQFLLDEDGEDRDDYDSAEEVWNYFDSDWGSGSPIPMVLKQGRRIIKDSGFDPAGDESKSESSYEKLEYEKGHKNSKGEDAPWVIRSHTDGRVLASFADKDAAEQHLARMKSYADKN